MRIFTCLLITICYWACSSLPGPPESGKAPLQQQTIKATSPRPLAQPEQKGPSPHAVVSHWSFDEGSGSVARDASGGSDGTIHEASWATGPTAEALRFAGPRSYVAIPDRPALNPSGPFEIALGLYIEARPPGYATLIEKGGGFGSSFRLLLMRRGNIRAAIGTEHLTVDSPTALSLNQWHQIDMIYTGRELQLKIDGQESGQREVTKPNLKSSFNVVIGRGLVGMIDDVEIINRQ